MKFTPPLLNRSHASTHHWYMDVDLEIHSFSGYPARAPDQSAFRLKGFHPAYPLILPRVSLPAKLRKKENMM